MLFRMTILTLTTCSLALTACSSRFEKREAKTVDAKAIKEDKTLTSEQKAEKLADASEELIGTDSFMFADEVATEALTFDKKNKQALLVKALVGPAMATRGIMERVIPLVKLDEESIKTYERIANRIESNPTDELKLFAYDGKQDIKNEEDIQTFLDTLRRAFERQRLFFKENKDLETTITLSTLFEETVINQEDACYWQRADNLVFKQLCVEGKDPATIEYKLNRADIESLQQSAAGSSIYLSLLNAYNVSGSITVAKNNKKLNKNDAAIREQLLQDPNFGILRNSSSLNTISSLGVDVISGIRWASSVQDQICSTGSASKANRPGHVVEKGLCFKEREGDGSKLAILFEGVETAVKGGTVKKNFKGRLGEYKTSVNPSKFVKGSVKNVRSLGLDMNECNNVVSAKDLTLGGVFPMQDANAVLQLNGTSCRQ